MKPLPKLLLKIAGMVLALVVALALALYYVVEVLEWPGGMHSSYDAKDYDPRLTREAATAVPVIARLERYHAEHSSFPKDTSALGAAPPSDRDALLSFVPDGPDSTLGWYYFRAPDGTGYILSRSLGWDPSLAYHREGTGGRWVFNPGDGSPEKPIRLKP